MIQRRIQRLAFLQLLGLGAAATALGYWQVVRGQEMANRTDNPRLLDERLRTLRGRILDRNGKVIAESQVAEDGYVKRLYRVPSLAATVGFLNPSQGPAGLEAAYDDVLSGRRKLSADETLRRTFLNERIPGSDILTTLDLDLQAAAVQALASGPQTAGAVVAIDPRNGAIRALATAPVFDPNKLTFDPTLPDWTAQREAIAAYAASLARDPGRPLINRPLQGLYPPGSTFKTLTLAASLEQNATQPNERFTYQLRPADRDHRAPWHANQFVSCQNHSQSTFDLIHAYAYSCNITFSDLGTRLGRETYLDMARRFGLEDRPPLPIETEISRLKSRDDFFTGQEAAYALASTAMGQGELEVTPIQMALVAASMAGNGQVLAPYLVEEVRRPDGTVTDRHRPVAWKPGVNQTTADRVRQIMVTSVDEGWASGARIVGNKIGGKTGTAELGGDRLEPHAWFIGFATADNPRLAIALIKEASGSSSAVAAPAAKILFEAALKFA